MPDWNLIAQSVIVSIATPILITLVVMSPMGAVAWVLLRKKKQYLARADEPFTDLPLRPPGESIRERIEELTEKYDSNLTAAAMAGAVTAAILCSTHHSITVYVGIGLVLLAVYAYVARNLVKIARQLWRYRLGYKGERAVGEELNQLLACGFRVFHDLPFDGFNIDHVIVGPPGVYAIETKTRRKPADIKGLNRATVVSDGSSLQFPKFNDITSIEQARRNAKTVSAWLTKATGEPVHASGIVALPGWFVDRRARCDVNVLNPGEIKHCFPTRPSQPLSPEQIQRIAHQLTERCRISKKTK